MRAGAVTACRGCGEAGLAPVLDLGETPIANALVAPGDANGVDARYPLTVVRCPRCSLVQLGHTLPADVIFDEAYPYYSSFSDALCAHAQEHVDRLVDDGRLGPGSLLVEVASNDGYLLRRARQRGVRVLGIDPASGPAAAAEAVGVPTLVAFFGERCARDVVARHGRADVVIANNVMAHVPDLEDFVEGLAVLLADGGLLTVENPWVRDLVDHVEFDTIYHEHVCYFSCTAVDALMRRHGLTLVDVEHFPDLHGGTLRWHVRHDGERTARAQSYLDREAADGLTGAAYYAEFAGRVERCQRELREALCDLARQGRTVAAYGAAAKGATLLNTAGIGTDLVAYVVDRNPHKQGKLMPGCRLPIRPVEALTESPPDVLLLLAWNFAGEIAHQQEAYLEAGGRFLVPVPSPHFLGAA